MPPMEGNIFYEHGHRMVATTVGLLTIGMAVWLMRADRRRWLRNLGWISLVAGGSQGGLGGGARIFLLPTTVSVGAACLAPRFFSALCGQARFTSHSWSPGGA